MRKWDWVLAVALGALVSAVLLRFLSWEATALLVAGGVRETHVGSGSCPS